MAETGSHHAGGTIRAGEQDITAADVVLLKQRKRKETLREVYVKGRETLIKRYLVDENARYYPRPWLVEDRALRRLEGLPVPRSHGFTEKESGGRLEAIFTREFIEGNPVSMADSRNIALMAALVARIHSKGVVTRDIDPNNFLVGGDGAMRFLDFGKALIFGRPGAVSCWWMGSDLARFMKTGLDYDRQRWRTFWQAYLADHRLSRVNRAIVWFAFLFCAINRRIRNALRPPSS